MAHRRIVLALAAALLLVGCGRNPLLVLAPHGGERIAFVAPQGDVFTIAPDGTGLTRLTERGGPADAERRSVHFWPSWSPDGRRIAVVRADLENEESTGTSLHLLSTDGGSPRQAFVSDQAMPFFYAWAPDGRSLAFLSQETGGISLRVASPNGVSGEALARGRSLYLGWSPDGASLVAHLDGDADRAPAARVSTMAARGGALRDLPVRPNGFRTPAYTPDGRSVVVGGPAANGRAAVLSLPLEGGASRTLLETEGTPHFLLSPRGDRVAVTVDTEFAPGLAIGVEVVDVANGSSTRIFPGPILGFFWSPDGTRLAWVAVEIATRELVWYVGGDGRAEPQRVAAFTPSQALVATLSFFDQYAPSTAVWSPDSRSLLFTGWVDDLLDGPSQVWIVEASADARPRAVADGLIASWSPPHTP